MKKDEFVASIKATYPTGSSEVTDIDQKLIDLNVDMLLENSSPEVREILKNVPIITLSKSDIEICSLIVPGTIDQYVILIEHRFILYIRLIMCSTFWALEKIASSPSKSLNKDDAFQLAKLIHDLFGYLRLQIAFDLPDFAVEKFDDNKVLVGLSNVINFVIAHEFAHITNAHFNKSNITKLNFGFGEVDFCKPTQQYEFDADSDAFGNMITSISKFYQKHERVPEEEAFPRESSVLNFLTSVSVLEMIEMLCNGIIKKTEGKENFVWIKNYLNRHSHPSAKYRYDALLNNYRHKMLDKEKTFCDLYEQILIKSYAFIDDEYTSEAVSKFVEKKMKDDLVEDIKKYFRDDKDQAIVF